MWLGVQKALTEIGRGGLTQRRERCGV